MKTAVVSEKTAIKPEQLIGTKWVSWSELFDDQLSVEVEFVDGRNCIYNLKPRQYPLTYNVKGGKLFISHIDGAFELRGDVLFNNNLPVFEKAA